MIDDVKNRNRHYIFCNAWGIYRFDPPVKALYADDPLHPFNRLIADIAHGCASPAPYNRDIVFAAGNCGQFCPDQRCGHGQIGEGRSIFGAAAIANVLTTGAVRCDGIPLGYTAEGPSPPAFASRKPDLVLPSQFADDQDRSIGFTGSSTACALAAGALAGLRRLANWRQQPPAALHDRLRQTARPVTGAATPNETTGYGILDLRRAFKSFPP
jgi:Subtilase family